MSNRKKAKPPSYRTLQRRLKETTAELRHEEARTVELSTELFEARIAKNIAISEGEKSKAAFNEISKAFLELGLKLADANVEIAQGKVALAESERRHARDLAEVAREQLDGDPLDALAALGQEIEAEAPARVGAMRHTAVRVTNMSQSCGESGVRLEFSLKGELFSGEVSIFPHANEEQQKCADILVEAFANGGTITVELK